MKKIAIIGSKKSGKTTIAEILISNLTDLGLTVATLKHIHHADFTMDEEGSDTWRHRRAGAKVVGYLSPREAGFITDLKDEPKTLEDVLEVVKISNVDVLMMEGFHRLVAKRDDVGKVIAFKDLKDLEERLEGTEPPILAACTFNEDFRGLSHNNVNILLLPRDSDKLLRIVEIFVRSP
ncbi:MAG: molybdopterin-guanine dinucleotide biosynthesis protein B [Candidatus Nezhaarchaeota archaeon]|nr:molybdopterin-guanine dinucleotide biosynthesis protein B [Candidatus Nezhaarchaeota archaeon]MCX8142279.1 molybdopterin-guanine dinucleotide biosynthesis protein B [Candidatus Nezhaarchaeota archaeon]MDW8050748.1 molybdopterin-guanine dinucleotide biosynthesis protein B [Nitrososphaerota archaeon]